MDAVVGGKAETILTNAGIGMNNDPVADDAIVIDHRVGIENAVAPNASPRPNIHARVDDRALTDGSRRIDGCARMNPGMRVLSHAMQMRHRDRERVVRVL